MNESELRIIQFNFFCTILEQLMKTLIARKGKLTTEDYDYIWKQGMKILENNVNIKQ